MSEEKNQLSPEMQEKMRAFQARYAGKLRAKLDEMDVQLAIVREEPADRARLQVLIRQLHSLAGSAGTFGFAELGAAARTIEQQALAWHDGAGCSTRNLDDLTAQLAQLASSLPA